MSDTDPRIEVTRLLAEGGEHAREQRFPEAETCYRRAAAIDPQCAEAYYGLAHLAYQCANGQECLKFTEMALTLRPTNHAYHFQHGIAQGMLGNLDYALSAYRRALQHNPANIQALVNLIFTSDLHPATTPEHALALRRQFDATFCQPYRASAAAVFGQHRNRPDPDRRLRIGYVSGDFRAHSAAAAFGPVIMHHDREQFEVYCYSTHNPPEGAHQRAVFQEVTNWRELPGEPGAQAQEVADDRIDILVDLSAYTAGSALQMFGVKPAPIQVSAWGYITGTGLETMDYLFADAVTVPPEAEAWYSETVVRLPAIFPYAHTLAPEIRQPAPWTRNGYATYGYLGRGTKITYATLDTWAAVLRADPTSRLLLKSDSYAQKAMYRLVVNGLLARGIDNARVEVRFGTTREEHLAAHNEVDVILDPIPQTGGISTCDALLMGVPVVTLLGKRIPERVSASILTSIGHSEMICTSVDEYTEKAVTMRATGVDRQAIRAALEASPLADHEGYTRAVEMAYRTLWRGHCSEVLKQREGEAAA